MRVLLLLYVGDVSIAYPSTAATIAKEIKRSLAEKYKVTNLGTAKRFLGIEISTETSGKQARIYGCCGLWGHIAAWCMPALLLRKGAPHRPPRVPCRGALGRQEQSVRARHCQVSKLPRPPLHACQRVPSSPLPWASWQRKAASHGAGSTQS